MDIADKSHYSGQERTLGDGMESTLIKATEKPKIIINNKTIKYIILTSKPIKPTSPIIMLTPKYIPRERRNTNLIMQKQKEPKFVPYEPYKCAVLPIVPSKRKIKKEQLEVKYSKNNVDINNLVEQMSEIRASELEKGALDSPEDENVVLSKKQWESEKTALENDIKNLRETNSHLENQLKFQAQVNSELKTLLVAAVGEDLESRVQHLTEDKLQLARALLNSANHLTSHQEQTEWLSGQCEVWRSKFLASSLMVEELARWKSALYNRVNELQDNIKCLLEERNKVHNNSIKSLKCLADISKHLEKDDRNKTTFGNLIEASEALSLISENVKKHLNIPNYTKIENLVQKLTPAENSALQILRNPVSLPNKPDAICSAVMGAAMSIGGGQMFLQHPSSRATCCAHCMGEEQEV